MLDLVVRNFKAIEEAKVRVEGITVIQGDSNQGKCQPGFVKVDTSSGYKRYDEIVSSSVEGFTEVTDLRVDIEQGSVPVSKTFFERNAVCRKLDLEKGKPQYGTLSHPIYAWKKDEVEPRFVKFSDLSEGDYVALSLGKNFDLKNFDVSLLRKGYLYGYVLGDGGVTLNGSVLNLYFQSSDPRDCEFLKSIDNPINTHGDDYSLSGDCNLVRYPLSKSCLKDWLTEVTSAYDKSLHKDVFTSKQLAFSVLCGLLASDGSSCSKGSGYVEFSTSSFLLKEGFVDLLSYLGVPFHVKERSTYYTKDGKKVKGAISYRIHIGCIIQKIYASKAVFLQNLLGIPADCRLTRVFKEYSGRDEFCSLSLDREIVDYIVSKVKTRRCGTGYLECSS